VADVKKAEAMWSVLRSFAAVALEECDKAEEEQEARI
jgi:hypothetical protein